MMFRDLMCKSFCRAPNSDSTPRANRTELLSFLMVSSNTLIFRNLNMSDLIVAGEGRGLRVRKGLVLWKHHRLETAVNRRWRRQPSNNHHHHAGHPHHLDPYHPLLHPPYGPHERPGPFDLSKYDGDKDSSPQKVLSLNTALRPSFVESLALANRPHPYPYILMSHRVAYPKSVTCLAGRRGVGR